MNNEMERLLQDKKEMCCNSLLLSSTKFRYWVGLFIKSNISLLKRCFSS